MTTYNILLNATAWMQPTVKPQLEAWRIPKATVFGTADWYQCLRFDQQQCIYVLSDFLKRWQENRYPEYAANFCELPQDTYDWLFAQIINKKEAIYFAMGLEINLSIKEVLEGKHEDSFRIKANIQDTDVSLKFILKKD